jgi:hypothetical protein
LDEHLRGKWRKCDAEVEVVYPILNCDTGQLITVTYLDWTFLHLTPGSTNYLMFLATPERNALFAPPMTNQTPTGAFVPLGDGYCVRESLIALVPECPMLVAPATPADVAALKAEADNILTGHGQMPRFVRYEEEYELRDWVKYLVSHGTTASAVREFTLRCNLLSGASHIRKRMEQNNTSEPSVAPAPQVQH